MNFDNTNTMYEIKPAEIWEEGFPLGNGNLGAMVFGNPINEKISLNNDTLWSGYPRNDDFRTKDGTLNEAKKLMRENHKKEAEELLKKQFMGYSCESYLPMCDLELTYKIEDKNIKNYIRYLDFKTAVNTIAYENSNDKFEVASFVSAVDKAFVLRVKSQNSDFGLRLNLISKLFSKTYVEGDCLILDGEATSNSEQNIERTSRKGLYFDEPEKKGMRFTACLKTKSDGVFENSGCEVNIKNAHYVEIYLTSATSFNGFDKHPYIDGKDSHNLALSDLENVYAKNYNDILDAHIKDFSSFYNRVSIDLGNSTNKFIPTSERIKEVYSEHKYDSELLTLMFNYGRYLTISGSRAGTQPLNLQGIWNQLFFPPWHSNYTININTEMNYYPTLQINLEEMYEPLLTFIKNLSVAGRSSAKNIYHAPGWVCHHNTDIWCHNQPTASIPRCGFWCMGSGWLCNHIYEYYEYTQNKDFLAKFMPIMCGAAEFYLSQIETLPNGERGLYLTTSPENGYIVNKNLIGISETTEMSMAIIRKLFANILKSSEILGVENDIVSNVRHEYPLLYTTKIGSDGRILEWYGEQQESEVTHRHISHLYALFPGDEITVESTPKLAEAAKKVLIMRGDESSGWSIAWKSNLFARLHDGNHSLKLLQLQLRPAKADIISVKSGGGTLPNMLCAHPPFQIDGNFGATSAIAQMLLQSTVDSVSILPACPDEWTDISVCGLRAKGNRTVSFTMKNGKLANYKIEGTTPKKILFKNVTI